MTEQRIKEIVGKEYEKWEDIPEEITQAVDGERKEDSDLFLDDETRELVNYTLVKIENGKIRIGCCYNYFHPTNFCLNKNFAYFILDEVIV